MQANSRKVFSGFLLVVLGLVVTACATMPAPIGRAPPGDPQLAEVRDNVGVHTGTLVRWGGTILSVENKDNETWIEVLEFKLTNSGQPTRYSPSDGRFLVHVNEFLDPAVYRKGRAITVIGPLEGDIERSIGEHPYSFPVVKADEHYMWTSYRRQYYYPRYYYGSYYYPYHYGFHYGHGHHLGFHFRHRRHYHHGHSRFHY